MGLKRSRQDSVSSSEDPSTPYSRQSSADVKLVHLDADSAVLDQPAAMRCSLPPHPPLSFASFDEYDVHYQKTHTNRCSECHKNFPDGQFLLLHIAEYHDPIVAARRDQGEKTYACLVPTCDRLCSTPQKRRLHCIDKHDFPRNYDFIIVKDGIDRRNSMLITAHRRRSSAFSSASGVGGATERRRGESSASTTLESMDIVDDEDEAHTEEDGEELQSRETRRYPTRLRGRGGFGHARIGSGRGDTASPKPPPATTPTSVDPMENLASRMSALQFVPHSVRLARGRGRGRGG